jgi:BNR-Asp box repeat
MSERMLVATRKGLISLAKKNGGWTLAGTAFLSVPVTAVLHDARDGALYAVLKHGHFGGKLHRSDDGGKSWAELPAPAFPEDAADKPSLFQVWTLETGGAAESGTLWAGALPAGLFRSEDRGESWRQVSSLWNVPERAKWFGGGYDDAGIHTVLPDPRDAKRLFVAISCGGVWESLDAGNSWKLHGKGMVAAYLPPDQAGALESQDPHRVARCAAAPEVMWMQHHCGIFRSTDAGCTWTQLKLPMDDFGFAVAAHPKDPNTAWFVPAIKDEMRVPRDGALTVTRTRDGGKTWESLRAGLPQRDAYDLVYRHGLDVDETGSRLAMGSTTGSLWVSENGGEAWQLVNAHLPPIYAVRLH